MTETITTDDDATEAKALSSSASDRASWLATIEEAGEEAGYFQTVGARHWAFFSDRSPTLLVTFETADSVRAAAGGLPRGHALAQEHDWSSLCIIADGETWYRDDAVYRYFDRLVDDAFFEDFDRVVFHGAGMGAYAACAYSVAAPGATVLAVQPVATLDPAVAGWDPRFERHRRLCFTDRYGFAPDMTDGAGQVFVMFDPTEQLDAMHAALFARPHVTALRCRHLGRQTAQSLDQMAILPKLIAAACDGSLDAGVFHRLYRQRRRHGPYLRGLLTALDAGDRPWLEALVARNVSSRMQAPRFRQRLAELTAQGISLPPQGAVAQP